MMKNWFEFKGIRSDYFGIFIQQMPPIQKPPKRHNLTYIDGVDGAEVEELGYEPYDKLFRIGLKHPGRINEINSWLTGSGDLILSSEPEFKYEACVLSEIEYRRVIRFHFADIVFLVQPYKYLVNEQATTSLTVYNAGTVDSLPLMRITGSGEAQLLVNDFLVCTLDIDEYVVLDSRMQNAYKGNQLKNRQMTGSFPVLKPGKNVISYIGGVTEIETLARSRFL